MMPRLHHLFRQSDRLWLNSTSAADCCTSMHLAFRNF